MSRECPDIEELGDLVDIDRDDPRMSHVNGCVRCRNLLASMREFKTPGELPPGATVSEAEAKLGQFLEHEMAGVEHAQARQPSRLSGWRNLLFRPVTGFALAAVAVVVVLTVWQQPDHPDPIVVRGSGTSDSPQLVLAAPAPLENGGTALSWNSIEGADSYHVVLYGLGLTELKRFPARSDTFLIIGTDDWPTTPPDGRRLIWQVHALRQGDHWIQSRPAGIERSE